MSITIEPHTKLYNLGYEAASCLQTHRKYYLRLHDFDPKLVDDGLRTLVRNFMKIPRKDLKVLVDECYKIKYDTYQGFTINPTSPDALVYAKAHEYLLQKVFQKWEIIKKKIQDSLNLHPVNIRG